MLKRQAEKVRQRGRERTADKSEVRRCATIAALHRLILEKGYAGTTLTDLARAAGMSVSHLLYYFPGKEAVLEELCRQICSAILAEITSHRDDLPEERIHVLVDHVFTTGTVTTRSDLGIALELIALSLHKPGLRQILLEYNRAIMDYLTDLFEKVPRAPELDAAEAAEIAGAVWMGLFTDSFYDERLTVSRARRLFRQTLLRLAGLGAPSAREPSLRVVERSGRARAGRSTPRRPRLSGSGRDR